MMQAEVFMTATTQTFPSSCDLQHEWQQCCSLALGYNLLEDDDDDEKNEDRDIVLVSFLDNDDDPLDESDERITEAWMENANHINDSLNNIIDILRRKKDSYLQPNAGDEASLLESTVLSFVATTANQVDSLQKAISSSNRDYVQHCAGIVSYLMATLKEEVANPFAKMQKQRARPVMALWENPLQCRLVSRLNPTDDEEEDQELRFLPKAPRPSQAYDFLDAYQIGKDLTKQEFQRPTSILRRRRPQAPPPSKMPRQNSDVMVPVGHIEGVEQLLPYLPSKPPNEEDDDYHKMLQHEALVLTATLQNDLDSVQQVEARMTEITALLAQFSNLVSEQQTEITNIHETTVQSKKNVEKGHDHLVDAAERTKKSRHYMATVVAFMAFLLLFFNTIKR